MSLAGVLVVPFSLRSEKRHHQRPRQLLCLLQDGYNVSYHNLLATTGYNIGYHNLLATAGYNIGYHTLLATAGYNIGYHTLLATAWYNVGAKPPPAPLGRLVSVALWLASLAMSAQHQAPSLPSAPKGGSPKGFAFPPPTFFGSPISLAPKALRHMAQGI